MFLKLSKYATISVPIEVKPKIGTVITQTRMFSIYLRNAVRKENFLNARKLSEELSNYYPKKTLKPFVNQARNSRENFKLR